MEYKFSKYNLMFEREGKTYIWNTLTGALLQLNAEDIRFIGEFETYDVKDILNSEVFKTFIKSGCLVLKSYDELGKILFDEKSTMLNPLPNALHYTIAPGLGCNYNCIYCFEKNRESHKSMDPNTQDEVCDFIIKNLSKNTNAKKLRIKWFGGEPLLYIDAICHISERLMNFCDANEIEYSASIVTNGRLLTADIAKKLANNKVDNVQLAVDGMPDKYAMMKGCSKEDFHEVINNIISCADIIPITVRINFSDYIDDAHKLTEYLLKSKKLEGKIKVYIAHVRDYEGRFGEDERASHADFLKKQREYMSKFGRDKEYQSSSLAYIVPLRKCTTCFSVCMPNYCIGPEGELYKCEHFFGHKNKIVGTIKEGRFYTEDERRYLYFQHPTKCMECSLLPVCMGGCMNDVNKGNVQIACEELKDYLIDCVMRKYMDN